jgi:hypothetical protein
VAISNMTEALEELQEEHEDLAAAHHKMLERDLVGTCPPPLSRPP